MSADLPHVALESIGAYLEELDSANDDPGDSTAMQLLQRTKQLQDMLEQIDASRVEQDRYEQIAAELDGWVQKADRTAPVEE
jgi:hypothetical protein